MSPATDDGSLTSHLWKLASPNVRSCNSAAAPRSGFRAATTTLAPLATNAFAAARPMPVVPPTIMQLRREDYACGCVLTSAPPGAPPCLSARPLSSDKLSVVSPVVITASEFHTLQERDILFERTARQQASSEELRHLFTTENTSCSVHS